jgi:pimeloyl-ACP methyl ester carboxylesterase
MAMTRGHRFRGVTPKLLPQLLHPDHLADTTLCQTVLDMAEHVGRDAFLRQQEAILARPASLPMLPSIAVPCLVGVGDHDKVTPPELAQEMAGLIPKSELRLVANAGHLPPMEQPCAVNEMLRDWLSMTG